MYLLIDTCIWIKLAQGQYKDDDEMLKNLTELSEKYKVRILVPDVIIDEWNRNKDKVIRKLEVSLDGRLQAFSEIKPFLSDAEGDQLSALLESIRSSKRLHQSIIDNRIQMVEALLHKHSFRIGHTDEIRQKAIGLALKKLKPFGSKNSMGDALLFLSGMEFAAGTKNKLYFITENTEDFSASKPNVKNLHDDLVALIPDNVEWEYSINVAEIINRIVEETKIKEPAATVKPISPQVVQQIEQGYTFPCPGGCGNRLHEKHDGGWRPSIYGGGISWWHFCNRCGRSFDTGEYFD